MLPELEFHLHVVVVCEPWRAAAVCAQLFWASACMHLTLRESGWLLLHVLLCHTHLAREKFELCGGCSCSFVSGPTCERL